MYAAGSSNKGRRTRLQPSLHFSCVPAHVRLNLACVVRRVTADAVSHTMRVVHVQVIATALHVIVNCVTAPPSLAYLLPPPGSAAGTYKEALAAAVAWLGSPGFRHKFACMSEQQRAVCSAA